MEVWAGLRKIAGCDLCGLAKTPIVKLVKEGKSIDLCMECYNKVSKINEFKEQVSKGQIKIYYI